MDLVYGGLAIIVFLVLGVMWAKASLNRYFIMVGIGLAVILLINPSMGPVYERVVLIALILSIAVATALRYREVRKESKLMEELGRLSSKHSVRQVTEIVQAENKLRAQFTELSSQLNEGKISEETYQDRMAELFESQRELRAQYDVSEDELDQYYQFFLRE